MFVYTARYSTGQGSHSPRRLQRLGLGAEHVAGCVREGVQEISHAIALHNAWRVC